jgi:hypothetical protein
MFTGTDDPSPLIEPQPDEVSDWIDDEDLDTGRTLAHIRLLSRSDSMLQEALFNRMVTSSCPPHVSARAIQWLLQNNFKATPQHCRKAAFSCGHVSAIRVMIMEAKVDVCGLDLSDVGTSSSSGKHGVEGHGGWIQHCKHAVKVLLARGAVLGSQGSRSKLLKRLESDGDNLWANRVLDAMGEELPEIVMQQLRLFLGV